MSKTLETMTALVNFASAPRSVELRAMEVPKIGARDVLLQVKAVGICGSDLHQYHGTPSWKVNYPVALGHEFAGVIIQTGAQVRAFEMGERVVSETAAVVDEQSPFTRAGQYHLDPNRLGFGYGVHGAMTQFVRVPERCLHRVPDDLALEKAALAEPCCVAYNAVCVNTQLRPGDSVAVIGPGPIGLLCALMAKLSGANPLIVVGTAADARRLQVAREIGATQVTGADGENVGDEILKMGDGYGVDAVIDAAGVSATLQLAMQIVRPGGQITKVGWGPQPCNFSLDPIVQKGVTLQGSFSHHWPLWERVIAMLASGQIDLDPILSRVAPLKEWQSCFEQMQSGDLVKAVLVP